MGTTPTRGLPYPEPTDLVTAGHVAIRSLAEATATELDDVDGDRVAAIEALRSQTRLRRIGRGRVVIDNPPGPGQSRTRTVDLDPAFGAEGSTPRVVVSTGGDARVNGQPYMATVTATAPGGFTVEVFPICDPTSTSLATGSALWVEWVAVGEA